MSEKIVGLTVSTLTGEKILFSGLSNVHCRLIFTTDRIIVQTLSSQTRQSYPEYGMNPNLVNLLVERGVENLLGDSAKNSSSLTLT